MMVAAPLIAVGAPLVGILWAMPSGLRPMLVSAVQMYAITGPLASIHSACLGILVLRRCAVDLARPGRYHEALEHEAVHIVQHLCFFGTAALFWLGARARSTGSGRLRSRSRLPLVIAVHGAVLGALLTVSPRVRHAPYLAHSTLA